MLDYVLNLEVFEAGAESVLASHTYALIGSDADLEGANLLSIFKFTELIDSLRGYEDAQKEQIISYLLDKYCIAKSVNSPFDNDSLGSTLKPTLPVTGSVVYWEDVLGKPVSPKGTNATNLQQFVLDLIPDIDATLTEDIVVSPGISGLGVSSGDVLELGITFTEALKRILNKILYPSYSSPSAILVSTVNGYLEVGTTTNSVVTGTFTKNDAGNMNKFEVFKNGSSIYVDNTSPFTQSYGDSFIIDEGAVSYQGRYYYDEGVTKNTTPAPGEPWPTGKILAGFVNSNTTQVVGIHPWFYGSSSSNSVPDIYSGSKMISLSNGSLIVSSFGVGTKYLWFAVPKTSEGTSQKLFTTWFRNALDNGSIGGSSNLFKSPVTISVTSTGLTENWTRDYDLYFSNYATEASTQTTLN